MKTMEPTDVALVTARLVQVATLLCVQNAIIPVRREFSDSLALSVTLTKLGKDLIFLRDAESSSVAN